MVILLKNVINNKYERGFGSMDKRMKMISFIIFFVIIIVLVYVIY